MVEVPLFNAILKTSDAENMLSRLLLFHTFLILCMKCFPLSFVLRCAVLVAVSFLVSQKRPLWCRPQSASQGFLRSIRNSHFPAYSALYFHLEVVIWNFIAWKLPKVVLLKFTGQNNDFNGSFKWLQYGWSATWQACCISWFTSVGCIHQLPAFQKSLRSSRNGSSRLLSAQWMIYLDRFSVIIFGYFLFFFRGKLQPTSWASVT